jgi:hypothetical protein
MSAVAKTKKHILTFEQEYDFDMLGICSHHNDYRLAWGINEELSIQLKKAEEDYVITNKKGQKISQHSLYEFRDEENLIEYYLIKNKSLGKYLIPEKPAIDYFLFLFENHIWEPEDLLVKLKNISSVLGGFIFDPEEFESTELLVFN